MAYEYHYISEIDGQPHTCYRCDVCGDGYSSMENAQECEREHAEEQNTKTTG